MLTFNYFVSKKKDSMGNELLTYFNDVTQAALFAEFICLPFLHHHQNDMKIEKKRKTSEPFSLIFNSVNNSFKSKDNLSNDETIKLDEINSSST
jgi:hypothetical protein